MRLILMFLFMCLYSASTLAGPFLNRDPEVNFEAFWRIFNENYAHFETREVDWKEQYDRYRPKVKTHTSDKELLGILNDMVAPLRDGHIVISPTGDLSASAQYSRFYQEFPTKKLQAQFHQLTLDWLYKQGFTTLKKFNSAPYDIGGYCRSEEYGYLQLNGFGGMPLGEFSKQLDEMIAEFADEKGLIIDIRINGGGSPAYLGALIGRLTRVKRLVGYGRSRINKKKNEYSPWTPYLVSPEGENQLVKPTILLTSGSTISAGDHCALYLREFPYVRLVGENTNGIFSSMLGKKLPNGWEISLSNGQTVSSKRISYEGRGVPVDCEVLHYRAEMEQGIDRGLEGTFKYLESNHEQLVRQTICYEQIALDYYADSLLTNQTYGAISTYSTGLVEEDATLLAPFAKKCQSLRTADGSGGMKKRIDAENLADSSFYRQNVQSRFYVDVRSPIQPKRRWHWPLGKKDARRLTVAHHITIGQMNFVRLSLSEGGWKGQTILVVVNQAGHVVEHCALSYNYLSGQFYN
jgi:hypothetical protein